LKAEVIMANHLHVISDFGVTTSTALDQVLAVFQIYAFTSQSCVYIAFPFNGASTK
jgi:hypothetical protein